jgi:hypothetical protein
MLPTFTRFDICYCHTVHTDVEVNCTVLIVRSIRLSQVDKLRLSTGLQPESGGSSVLWNADILRLHGVSNQKIATWIFFGVKASNVANWVHFLFAYNIWDILKITTFHFSDISINSLTFNKAAHVRLNGSSCGSKFIRVVTFQRDYKLFTEVALTSAWDQICYLCSLLFIHSLLLVNLYSCLFVLRPTTYSVSRELPL